MSILNSLISGVVGAGIATVAKNLIEKQGGVQGLLAQFEQGGLGDTMKSWIGTGENSPISSSQIQQVLGSDTVKNLAEKFGIPTDKLAEQLAEYLPQAVDKLTPNGTVEVSAAA